MLTKPRRTSNPRATIKIGAHYVPRHAMQYVIGELKLYRQRLRQLEEAKAAVALRPHQPTGMPPSPSSEAHDGAFAKFQAFGRDEEIRDLLRSVEPIDQVLRELHGPRDSARELKRRLLRMLYIEETHTLKGAAVELFVSEEYARRMAREAVWMVGVALGVF